MLEANKAIRRENKAMAKIHANKLQEFNLAEVIQKLKDRENNRKKYYNVAVEVLEEKEYSSSSNGDKKTYTTTRVYKTTIRARNKKDVKKQVEAQINSSYPYEDSAMLVCAKNSTCTISSNSSSNNMSKLDVPMKRGTPYTASFLK